jgi:hypothetical protein
MFMSCFMVLCQHFCGGTGEKRGDVSQDIRSPDPRIKPGPSEVKFIVVGKVDTDITFVS